MLLPRLTALATPLGFAALASTMAALALLPTGDAAWAALAVVLALVPTGWLAPAGWRRRASELALGPAALALVLVADDAMRRMVLPPLLLTAALAAAVAALDRLPRHRHGLVVAALGLSVRAATGLGLVGFGWWPVVLAVVTAAALPGAVSRCVGARAGVAAALLAGTLPLQRWPWVAVALLAMALVLDLNPRWRTGSRPVPRGWLPAVGAAALLMASTAAWGGLPPTAAFPAAGGWAVVLLVLALAASWRLPSGAAGALWMVAVVLLGPARPAPPDRPGAPLQPGSGLSLPTGTGEPYLLRLVMGNAVEVEQGAAVAEIRVDGRRRALTAGRDAAEWAHQREDVAPRVGHSQPARPVRRPTGLGAGALWGLAAETVLAVPPGVRPRLVRDPGLPEGVVLSVATAGPSRPTPPRARPLPWWLWATAAVVGLLQLAGGRLAGAAAAVPWAILVAGSAGARMAVDPLRLVLERHAADLCLAALVAAWVPVAFSWLRRRRPVLAAATLLLPLAGATAFLTPPMYGDEPFHLLVASSLVEDGDLDLSDDFQVEVHPDNEVYTLGEPFFHSPVTGVLLAPGYLLAGRVGALALLALAGAATVGLILRRAGGLGVPLVRRSLLGLLLLLTYPLATFSTQIWPGVLGALAASFAVAAAAARPPRAGWATLAAALATAAKTRLALVLFPVAVAAWWRQRPARRRPWGPAAALLLAALAALVFASMVLGHPFGVYRRLGDLVPPDPLLPLRVVAGLAFDPAGGLLFAAPLALVALASAGLLWRRGSAAERGLLVGGGLTVLALLHSPEWYGGGSPPARYLVPLLPAFALGGGLLLATPRRWRRLAELLLAPSLVVWWGLLTRPQHSINPGDGGWWLAAAMARRLGRDVDWLLPSFLAPRTATVVVPLLVVAAAAVVTFLVRRWPRLVPRLVAAGLGGWLLLGAGLVAAVTLRTDRVVQAEAPQVVHRGGRPDPPPGTFSRWAYRRGWHLTHGQGIEVPLELPAGAVVWLEGRLTGTAREGAVLEVSWDDGPVRRRRARSHARHERMRLMPPGPGLHRLQVTFLHRGNGALVLDRVVVEAAGH